MTHTPKAGLSAKPENKAFSLRAIARNLDMARDTVGKYIKVERPATKNLSALGVLEDRWAMLVEECEELDGVDSESQLRTVPWARPVLGFNRSQPHGSKQGVQRVERAG